MSLQPIDDTPGLWGDPDWQPGHPGTFAVVIGVSRYPHLDGGGAEADDLGERWIREARRLGQLTVSATTAWRFFRWLADGYQFRSAPLACCWLLLAPTPLEREREPALMRHVAEPTLANCELALRGWSAEMRRLPAAAQHGSRALFFFSGHGLQVHHEKQLLLPSDYLGGALPHWDDALSTSNLLAGLDSVQIPDRLYFVDACRNDFPAIRAKRPQGRSILPEDETAASYAETRLSAVLYATAASLQAWSPVDPSEGPSLFGQAVLAGLAGQPDIELTERDGRYAVELGKLQGFAMERVVQILEQHRATVSQRVTLGGPVIHFQVPVTEIPPQALAGIRPELAPESGVVTRGGTLALPESVVRPAAKRAADFEALLANTLSVSNYVLAPLDVSPNEVDLAVFGTRPVTELWTRQARWLSLSSRTEPAAGRLRLERVERDPAARSFRIHVQGDAEPRGWWLQVGSGEDTHGLLLPSIGEPVGYRIEAEISTVRGQAGFQRLEATLARGNTGALGEAARLWERYRTADAEAAIGALDLDALRDAVLGKARSPLAAAVAALVLMRADRLDLIHDWLQNLADWFPLLPDGAVLWAEQLMRRQTDRAEAVAESAESLCRLDERGLPFTSEGLSWAASLAERLGRAGDLVPSQLHDRLGRVRAHIDDAMVYLRPGGLFAAYAGFDDAALTRLLPPMVSGREAECARPGNAD